LDETTKKVIETVLDDVFKMEKLLSHIDRNRILTVLELLEKLDLDILKNGVESLQAAELDLRMARLRIQAITGLQPPSLISDPDRTPVEPLQARRRSSQSISISIPRPKPDKP